jgi:hypothetical protein
MLHNRLLLTIESLAGHPMLVRGRVSSQWPAAGTGRRSVSPRLIERVYALLAKMPLWLMTPVATFGHALTQARQLRGVKRRAEVQR